MQYSALIMHGMMILKHLIYWEWTTTSTDRAPQSISFTKKKSKGSVQIRKERGKSTQINRDDHKRPSSHVRVITAKIRADTIMTRVGNALINFWNSSCTLLGLHFQSVEITKFVFDNVYIP